MEYKIGDRIVHCGDELEFQIAGLLHTNEIEFIHESERKDQRLDFYLPKQDIYIEVKKYSSIRSANQLDSQDNVILIQGLKALNFFQYLFI